MPMESGVMSFRGKIAREMSARREDGAEKKEEPDLPAQSAADLLLRADGDEELRCAGIGGDFGRDHVLPLAGLADNEERRLERDRLFR
jgi:hypothetical protein